MVIDTDDANNFFMIEAESLEAAALKILEELHWGISEQEENDEDDEEVESEHYDDGQR